MNQLSCKKLVLSCLILFAVSMMTACRSDRPKGLPKLVPCSIKVVKDGQPLDAAFVSCVPEDPALKKWAVVGMTDASGVLQLFTQTYPGAPMGKYIIVVSKKVPGANGGPTSEQVAKEFTEKETSPLRLEIVKNMPNPTEIQVTGAK